MGARAFGRMVAQAMKAQGWKQQTLAVAIGILPDGTTWDSTRVRRLKEGRVRLEDHREAVARIIACLKLDPPAAWAAADLRPPWLNEDDYRASYRATEALGTYRNTSPTEDTTAGQRLALVA